MSAVCELLGAHESDAVPSCGQGWKKSLRSFLAYGEESHLIQAITGLPLGENVAVNFFTDGVEDSVAEPAEVIAATQKAASGCDAEQDADLLGFFTED